jgi:hypothetical protein
MGKSVKISGLAGFGLVMINRQVKTPARKLLYGGLRKEPGDNFLRLNRQKNCRRERRVFDPESRLTEYQHFAEASVFKYNLD